jgi:hypothetical protein
VQLISVNYLERKMDYVALIFCAAFVIMLLQEEVDLLKIMSPWQGEIRSTMLAAAGVRAFMGCSL